MSHRKKITERLPGDPSCDDMIARMIRVDQAGEYGAKRIYEGQLSIFGDGKDGPVLRHMAATEQVHLEKFNKMLVERRVRPTALTSLWHVAGYALGAGSALLGREAAMACTVAVEEIIEEHYADQMTRLDDAEADLKSTIEDFRAEEIEHKKTALDHGAKNAPGYELLTTAVKTGSRLAIWLSERI